MGQLNEGVINLDGVYVMPIINIISLRILLLSLKKLVDMSAKTQALEKVIRENTAVLTDKLQALEKLTKTDTREIQTKTEELKRKTNLQLHYKTRNSPRLSNQKLVLG